MVLSSHNYFFEHLQFFDFLFFFVNKRKNLPWPPPEKFDVYSQYVHELENAKNYRSFLVVNFNGLPKKIQIVFVKYVPKIMNFISVEKKFSFLLQVDKLNDVSLSS
jgi:hypothetical protein